jgi:hypothetical protein
MSWGELSVIYELNTMRYGRRAEESLETDDGREYREEWNVKREGREASG